MDPQTSSTSWIFLSGNCLGILASKSSPSSIRGIFCNSLSYSCLSTLFFWDPLLFFITRADLSHTLLVSWSPLRWYSSCSGQDWSVCWYMGFSSSHRRLSWWTSTRNRCKPSIFWRTDHPPKNNRWFTLSYLSSWWLALLGWKRISDHLGYRHLVHGWRDWSE